MVNKLTFALPKGRIFNEALYLLKTANIQILENKKFSRKLIFQTNKDIIKIIIVRASDIPTYVQYGAADFGIVGKDILLEYGCKNLYQLIDLNIAKCRLVVAVKFGFDYFNTIRYGSRLSIATKYIQITKKHFFSKGLHVDIIKLYGSIELGPLVGLSDAIVDLVGTGCTLKQNNLIEVEHIANISSILVVNKVSFKFKNNILKPILNIFKKNINITKN